MKERSETHTNKPHRYRHHVHQNYLHALEFRHRLMFYLITFIPLAILVVWAASGFHGLSLGSGSIVTVFHRISPLTVAEYSLYTFLRLLISFVMVVVISMVLLLIVLSSKKIEQFLLPIFDVLQSVPVLAFFPLIIVVFARLHLPELAAQVVLLVAMLWSVLYGAMGGVHQIPEDILDASRIYGGKGWKKFTKVILPAIFPNLVTGSQLSFGAGWNVIIISEYINYGNIQIRLPGLGSLLSSSAATDTGIFVVALAAMVIIITVLNRVVWHRLITYSEKFKFEE